MDEKLVIVLADGRKLVAQNEQQAQSILNKYPDAKVVRENQAGQSDTLDIASTKPIIQEKPKANVVLPDGRKLVVQNEQQAQAILNKYPDAIVEGTKKKQQQPTKVDEAENIEAPTDVSQEENQEQSQENQTPTPEDGDRIATSEQPAESIDEEIDSRRDEVETGFKINGEQIGISQQQQDDLVKNIGKSGYMPDGVTIVRADGAEYDKADLFKRINDEGKLPEDFIMTTDDNVTEQSVNQFQKNVHNEEIDRIKEHYHNGNRYFMSDKDWSEKAKTLADSEESIFGIWDGASARGIKHHFGEDSDAYKDFIESEAKFSGKTVDEIKSLEKAKRQGIFDEKVLSTIKDVKGRDEYANLTDLELQKKAYYNELDFDNDDDAINEEAKKLLSNKYIKELGDIQEAKQVEKFIENGVKPEDVAKVQYKENIAYGRQFLNKEEKTLADLNYKLRELAEKPSTPENLEEANRLREEIKQYNIAFDSDLRGENEQIYDVTTGEWTKYATASDEAKKNSKEVKAKAQELAKKPYDELLRTYYEKMYDLQGASNERDNFFNSEYSFIDPLRYFNPFVKPTTDEYQSVDENYYEASRDFQAINLALQLNRMPDKAESGFSGIAKGMGKWVMENTSRLDEFGYKSDLVESLRDEGVDVPKEFINRIETTWQEDTGYAGMELINIVSQMALGNKALGAFKNIGKVGKVLDKSREIFVRSLTYGKKIKDLEKTRRSVKRANKLFDFLEEAIGQDIVFQATGQDVGQGFGEAVGGTVANLFTPKYINAFSKFIIRATAGTLAQNIEEYSGDLGSAIYRHGIGEWDVLAEETFGATDNERMKKFMTLTTMSFGFSLLGGVKAGIDQKKINADYRLSQALDVELQGLQQDYDSGKLSASDMEKFDDLKILNEQLKNTAEKQQEAFYTQEASKVKAKKIVAQDIKGNIDKEGEVADLKAEIGADETLSDEEKIELLDEVDNIVDSEVEAEAETTVSEEQPVEVEEEEEVVKEEEVEEPVAEQTTTEETVEEKPTEQTTTKESSLSFGEYDSLEPTEKLDESRKLNKEFNEVATEPQKERYKELNSEFAEITQNEPDPNTSTEEEVSSHNKKEKEAERKRHEFRQSVIDGNKKFADKISKDLENTTPQNQTTTEETTTEEPVAEETTTEETTTEQPVAEQTTTEEEVVEEQPTKKTPEQKAKDITEKVKEKVKEKREEITDSKTDATEDGEQTVATKKIVKRKGQKPIHVFTFNGEEVAVQSNEVPNITVDGKVQGTKKAFVIVNKQADGSYVVDPKSTTFNSLKQAQGSIESKARLKQPARVDTPSKYGKAPLKKFEDTPPSNLNPKATSFVKALSKSLGLKKPIMVITKSELADGRVESLFEDSQQGRNYARAYKNAFSRKGVMGSMVSNNDSAMLFVDDSVGDAELLSLISHELGHHVQHELFEELPNQTKVDIVNEWLDWKSKQEKGSYQARAESRPATLQTLDFSEEMINDLIKVGFDPKKLEDLGYFNSKDSAYDYTSSFSEWFADNVAKFATDNAVPKNAIEKVFKKMADALTAIYNELKSKGFVNTKFPTIEKWLEEQFDTEKFINTFTGNSVVEQEQSTTKESEQKVTDTGQIELDLKEMSVLAKDNQELIDSMEKKKITPKKGKDLSKEEQLYNDVISDVQANLEKGMTANKSFNEAMANYDKKAKDAGLKTNDASDIESKLLIDKGDLRLKEQSIKSKKTRETLEEKLKESNKVVKANLKRKIADLKEQIKNMEDSEIKQKLKDFLKANKKQFNSLERNIAGMLMNKIARTPNTKKSLDNLVDYLDGILKEDIDLKEEIVKEGLRSEIVDTLQKDYRDKNSKFGKMNISVSAQEKLERYASFLYGDVEENNQRVEDIQQGAIDRNKSIKERYQNGEKKAVLAREYNVSADYVDKIISGKKPLESLTKKEKDLIKNIETYGDLEKKSIEELQDIAEVVKSTVNIGKEDATEETRARAKERRNKKAELRRLLIEGMSDRKKKKGNYITKTNSMQDILKAFNDTKKSVTVSTSKGDFSSKRDFLEAHQIESSQEQIDAITDEAVELNNKILDDLDTGLDVERVAGKNKTSVEHVEVLQNQPELAGSYLNKKQQKKLEETQTEADLINSGRDVEIEATIYKTPKGVSRDTTLKKVGRLLNPLTYYMQNANLNMLFKRMPKMFKFKEDGVARELNDKLQNLTDELTDNRIKYNDANWKQQQDIEKAKLDAFHKYGNKQKPNALDKKRNAIRAKRILGKKSDIKIFNKHTLTNDEVVYYYNVLKQGDYGNQLKGISLDPDEVIDYIKANPELEVYAKNVTDLMEEYRPEYSEVSERDYNRKIKRMEFTEEELNDPYLQKIYTNENGEVEIPKYKEYIPIHKKGYYQDQDNQSSDALFGDKGVSVVSLSNVHSSSLKSRGNADGALLDDKMSMEKVFKYYTEGMNRGLVYSETAKTIKEMFDGGTLDLLTDRFGKQFTESVENRLASDVIRREAEAPSRVNKMVSKAIGTLQAGVLMGNPKLAVLQQLSQGNYMLDAKKPLLWMAKLPQVLTTPSGLKMFAKLWTDPYIKDRTGNTVQNIDVAEMLSQDKKSVLGKIKDIATKAGMSPITYGDAFAVVHGGVPYVQSQMVYYQQKYPDISEDEAFNLARRDWIKQSEATQQSQDVSQRSQLQNNVWFRMIAPYSTTSVQYMREAYSALKDVLNGKEVGRNIAKTAYYGAVANALFNIQGQIIRSLFNSAMQDDDEKQMQFVKDMAIETIKSHARAVGFAGGLAGGAEAVFNEMNDKGYMSRQQFNESMFAGLSTLDPAYKGMQGTFNLVSNLDSEYFSSQEGVQDMVNILSLTGINLNPADKYIGNLMNLDESDYPVNRVLGQTGYPLGEDTFKATENLFESYYKPLQLNTGGRGRSTGGSGRTRNTGSGRGRNTSSGRTRNTSSGRTRNTGGGRTR